MNKVVVLVAVFALGLLAGYQLHWVSNSSSIVQPVVSEALVVPVERSVIKVAGAAKSTVASSEDLVKLLSVQTPKTQFEGYRAFQKLDQLPADEIIKILVSLNDSQSELRAQISWFFAGKFPEESFSLMGSSMGDNQLTLAQILFVNLTTNQPEQVFDWLQNNENDFFILFPVAEQQFERKMVLYQALSVFPDWKWTAYEAGVELVKSSMRPEDKWSSRVLAQTAAQANPQEAINYALAQQSGAVDGNLLNGALVEYAKTNPLEAKDLLVQNQVYADEFTVNSVIDKLLFRGSFGDAYGLASSLQKKEMVESVVISTASKIPAYGSDKVIDFVATIQDPALKVKAVGSATNSMSVSGYPVEKLLEIMDFGLRDVSAKEKSFNYAWVLKNGYKDDPQALRLYLNQMKSKDQPLATEVEASLGYMKDI